MVDYKMLLIEWQARLSIELDNLIKSLKDYVSEKKKRGETIKNIDFRI